MRRSELERRAVAAANGSAVTLEMVAKEAGVAQDVLAREALPILRHLVERGFLDPPELGKDGAPPRV